MKPSRGANPFAADKRPPSPPAPLRNGTRVFHEKFGIGTIAEIDGNKLTVNFDLAGQKHVVDCFVRATAGKG